MSLIYPVNNGFPLIKMHELSVTENILEIALRHADGANAKQISNIYLVIGQLSSIIDDSIQFYWDIISKGTLAEGAILQFKRITTKLSCQDCETGYSPENNVFSCPSCGSSRITVIAGNEFYLESIDIVT